MGPISPLSGLAKGTQGAQCSLKVRRNLLCLLATLSLGHQHPGRHVLLGLTSGGRSHVAECGGVNNPTVYVRLKTLVPWIKKHVDSTDLCLETE